MTYDEYKKQLNAKKQVQKEKIPQFNRRAAGEGEDLRNWQNFQHKYQKKNDDDKSDEIEYESGTEGRFVDRNRLTVKLYLFREYRWRRTSGRIRRGKEKAYHNPALF